MNKISKLKLGASYGYIYLSQQLALHTGFGAGLPSMLCGLLNWKCNFRCFFCLHPYYDQRPILSLSEWQRILDQLRKWLGVFRMNFLGGEPFLRPDLFDILHHAKSLGIMTGLTTNGSLITDEAAKELAKLGLLSIGISIDGVNPETHETIRGCPGQFEKILAGVASLKKHCPLTKIVIRTIMMEKNLDELLDIVNWVKDQGLTGVIFQPLDPTPALNPVPPRGDPIDLDIEKWSKSYGKELVKDVEKWDKICSELFSMKMAGAPIMNELSSLRMINRQVKDPLVPSPGRCPVSVQNFMIVPNGDVHTCCDTVLYAPIGNLRDASVEQLWKGRKARELRKKTRKCKQTCLFFSHARRSLIDNVKMFVKYI